MGRVSRNGLYQVVGGAVPVTPRMGRVSRNRLDPDLVYRVSGHAPHGACE